MNAVELLAGVWIGCFILEAADDFRATKNLVHVHRSMWARLLGRVRSAVRKDTGT